MTATNLPPPGGVALQQALAHHEARLRTLANEECYLLDPQGNVVLHWTSNLPHAIRHPPGQLQGLRQSGLLVDVVYTHNHPTDHSFSEEDFILASCWNFSEMRAVGPHWSYRMLHPGAVLRACTGATQAQVHLQWLSAIPPATRTVAGWIRQGWVAPGDQQRLLTQETCRLVLANYGIGYQVW